MQEALLPIVDNDSKIFWEGCRENRLMIPYCLSCERFFFYPRAICPHCFSEELEWREASGNGTVYSYTVIHRTTDPYFSDKTPYIVALIDLEEGVRMMSNVICDDLTSVYCGMDVKVLFEEVGSEWNFPKFIPN